MFETVRTLWQKKFKSAGKYPTLECNMCSKLNLVH